MENVLNFIKFALSHAHKDSVPKGANLPYAVGIDGIWEYLYGWRGQLVTQKGLDRAFEDTYSKEMSRAEFDKSTEGWVENKVHACDCQGLNDAYLHIDKSANQNYNEFCTDKGLISSINRPFVIGEAVFNGTDIKKTHVGWVCGFIGKDVLVVESRGFKFGVVITQMSKRAWKYRGLMTKKFIYTEDYPLPDPDQFIFRRELKKGCNGDDVIELKKLLIEHGYSEGITIDTKNSKHFGSNTKKLVKQFQKDYGLTIDGIAGRKTITALGGEFR